MSENDDMAPHLVVLPLTVKRFLFQVSNLKKEEKVLLAIFLLTWGNESRF